MKKLIALLTLSLLGACATTPRICVTPEVFFSKYGQVIQCEEGRTKDTGDRITQCYLEDANGRVYRKRMATRTCW